MAAKYAQPEFDRLAIILVRSSMALAFLLCLARPRPMSTLRVSPRHLAPLAVMGAAGIVGYVYFFLLALEHTSAGNTAIIAALNPLVTALAAAVALKERLSPANYFGVLVALAGVLVLVSGGDGRALPAVGIDPGIGFMLVAVGCSVIYALVAKAMSGRYAALTITIYMTLVAVVISAALVPAGALGSMPGASLGAWIALLFMGVVGSGAGYTLYNVTVRELGPTRTSCVVFSATPLLVMILAYFAFAEPITSVSLSSAVLICIGLCLTLAKHGRRPP